MEIHEPTEKIVEWSSWLYSWQRDALRRLAGKSALDDNDYDELEGIVRYNVGLNTQSTHPSPISLNQSHLGADQDDPVVWLKHIRNLKNVNILADDTALTFGLDKPTVVFGLNGSGKTGYIRVLRHACRTRLNDKNLQILSDVYGANAIALQEAEIGIKTTDGDAVVTWKPDKEADRRLARVSVFDSDSASLYINEGNQIEFLPFGLDLPFKLVDACIQLAKRLKIAHQETKKQLELAKLTPPLEPGTKVAIFYDSLSSNTTDELIDAACKMVSADEARLAELEGILGGSLIEINDLNATATMSFNLLNRFKSAVEAVAHQNIEKLNILQENLLQAREAVNTAATLKFGEEPLKGVGVDTWMRMWRAAEAYSITHAYPDHEFPVIESIGVDEAAHCVLCQQPLTIEASERLKRFRHFVVGDLTVQAGKAVAAMDAALESLNSVISSLPGEKDEWYDRVAAYDSHLRDIVKNWADALRAAHVSITETLANGGLIGELTLAPLPIKKLAGFASALKEKADERRAAINLEEREKLETEKSELTARKHLADGIAIVKNRRDLLKKNDAYARAIEQTVTTGITRRANEFVDEYLTAGIDKRFADERRALGIEHLKVGFARRNARTGVEYSTELHSKIKCRTADVLSEGEQRALALAAFLTETGISTPNSPIVIDDPVSSVDHQRIEKIAKRLATEAKHRQLIVLTHDLAFYNKLCAAIESEGLDAERIGVFRSPDGRTGRIDQAGENWKGLSVKKRLGRLKNDLPNLRKLATTSPSEYETNAKNLYGRLRDAYERFIEETLFCEVIRRFNPNVSTLRLKRVDIPDPIAICFHEGMSKASKYSHDNAEESPDSPPEPDEIEQDILALEILLNELKDIQDQAEARRPSMKV